MTNSREHSSPSTSPTRATTWIRPYQVVLIVCLVYLALIGLIYRNPLEFVRIGSRFDPSLFSRDAEGYDGQFAYYIARDPDHAAQYLDVPAYRFQRILYPVLARVLSLGNTTLLPWALIAINFAALVIGTALLERLLAAERASRWYALSYGLFAGVLVAVRSCTTEPLAYGLVIGALVAARNKRLLLFSILLAASALAKETTLFFALGYTLYLFSQRRWREAFETGLIVGIPFAIWQFVLYSKFGQFGFGSGGANATPFEWIPFNGIWRLAAYGPAIFLLFGLVVIPAVLLPTVWALWGSVRDIWKRKLHPYVFVLFANAAILPFVPFSTYREPFGIFRFMPGLVICVLLYAALRRMRRALVLSTLWIVFGLRAVG